METPVMTRMPLHNQQMTNLILKNQNTLKNLDTIPKVGQEYPRINKGAFDNLRGNRALSEQNKQEIMRK